MYTQTPKDGGRLRVYKHPVTYRLELDVLELVDLAVEEAASRDVRETKESIVAEAIRSRFGHLHPNGPHKRTQVPR